MEDYLTIAEAAQLTGLRPAHLAQLRYRGEGPRYAKPTPRKVLYRRTDVLAWLESSVIVPSAQGGGMAGRVA